MNKLDLTALLERVRNATGPDRLIDADLFFELDPEFPSGSKQMVAAIDPATFATGPYTSVHALPYTASIDAAFALGERVLPGRAVALGLSSNPSPYCGIAPSILVNAPTLPLAILTALLLALTSNQEGNDEA